MAQLISAFDWTATLGPIAAWPQSLKTTVGLLLHSPVPIVLLWGPDGIMLYNDAYSGFAGGRHPALLGSKVREGWPEVADFNDHVMKVGLAGGTLSYKDQELVLHRSGRPEPVWMNLDYSPVFDESGKPGGVIAIVVETTQQVLAQRRVQAQSERLAQMFQNAPSFMCQMEGPQHVFTFANDAYQQLIAHRDVIGKTVRDALPEIAGQGFYELLDKVYATGESFRGHAVPVTLQRRPGAEPEERLLDFIYQPVRDATGEVTGIFTEGIDVTAAVRDARALEVTQQQLQTALSAGRGVGTWDWDVKNDLVVADERFARLYGVDAEAARGGAPIAAFFANIHPEDAPRVQAQVQEGMRSGARFNCVYRLVQADGGIRWVEAEGQCSLDADGTALRFSGFTFDVTERIAAQEALRESERRLRFALDAAGMGSFVWDVETDIAEGDARMMALFGLPADGLLSLRTALADSIDPRDGPRYADAVARACDPAGNGVLREDIRVRWPDGSGRWLAISGQVSFGGEPRRAVQMAGAARDITADRRTEDRRAALVELTDRIRDIDRPEDIAFAAAEILGRSLGVSRAGYGTIDPKKETITIARDWNAPGISSLAGTLHFRDYGSYIEELKRGETVVITDAVTDPRSAASGAALKAISAQSLVNMPVSEDGGLVALLYLNNETARDWPEEELAFIRDVAERTRTAVERRRAEAELRESESLFRSFAQAVPNHVWAAGPDGQLDWFNQRVYDYSGAAPGTLDGAGWTRLVHPDDVEFAAARWNASLVSGAVYETEFRLRRHDGLYRWHIARAEPIRDDAGQVIRWVGTNTDIEDQKAALASLGELNAELERRVIERTQARGRTWQLSPDLMGALNSKGYFETSNPAWKSMLGWSEAEVASMSIFELLHPDDVERTRAGFQLTQEGQPAIQFPNRYRHKDGSYRWISWVGVPEDGYVYCSGRDITAERQRDAELQNIRTFYTYSSEYHAMLAQRDDGAFEYEEINPATLKLYGLSREQVVGRTVDDLFAPEIAADLNSHLREALRLDAPHSYIRSQGNTAIEAIATPVPEDGGRRRLTVTARDISLRLSLEEQLRQAQKMEAVGQLTGGIAHDFNNLLQGITGSLDRVQYRLSEGRTADVDRFLKAAIESANRAAALTHRLLAFSRRQTLDPKALDANKLIAGMEDLLRRTIGPNVSMEVVGAGGLWPIRVDPSQLENSLLNLCINARDAMPDGGKLTIETANKWLDERGAREHELTPGQYVSLSVSDNGIGMTDEVIARAFDPFFTTKPTGQGTGLGLSMIYGFVRQSGGQVRIYSEPGQGTTMCLYFPRHLGSVDDETSAVTETVERGFGETVLVVDDEATVRMLIAEVLSESFYNILEAGDGAAALKILETDRRVDLMITDVGLPGGMNGRQVADAARVLRKNLKVLFITGYAENAAIGGGHLDAGMEILAKPFAMSTLGNKVREMIEK